MVLSPTVVRPIRHVALYSRHSWLMGLVNLAFPHHTSAARQPEDS